MNAIDDKKLFHAYGDHFYERSAGSVYGSAKKYVSFFWSLYKPASVVDVGCGRGTWLKAFKEVGVQELVGYDGPWNSQQNMDDQAIRSIQVDLNNIIESVGADRYDLAISLEVAEHLEPASAPSFVETLTMLSDVVMFSAAYEYQGGTHHINEQRHTYWAAHFLEHDYVPYDLFRPVFWGDAGVEPWYRQNTFLYVKKASQLAQHLSALGHEPLANISLMNAIHPDIYDEKMRATPRQLMLSAAMRSLPRPLQPFARSIKTRIGL